MGAHQGLVHYSSKDGLGVPTTLLSFPYLIEEFFSTWKWRVYEHQAQNQRSLLHAMDAACDDITGDQCRGWL